MNVKVINKYVPSPIPRVTAVVYEIHGIKRNESKKESCKDREFKNSKCDCSSTDMM